MVTIEDVARHAGVATSTVSYALSGKRSISEQTRQRVERAVEELGYRPHAGARALASARTNTLGLMLPLRPGVDVRVVMEFVTGIVTRARAFDHDVLLVTQAEDAALERLAHGRMVDALILMDVEAADSRLARAAALGSPTILIGLPDDPQGLQCVDFDFAAAARLAVRHLSDLGHTSIGLIGPPPSVVERGTTFAERLLAGFHGGAERLGLTAHVELTPPTHAGALAAVEALRRLDETPTALIVHNEAALPSVVDSLQMHGVRIPADVSLVAICPADVAQSQSQPITFIDIPAESIGAVAVEMAMARLDRPDAPVETRLLRPTLSEGSSTAPRLTP
ncbi:LacI family DNA-binding transcriptional regulator [Pseudactinotalea suaedae]|uniref:LacI family DNA-binding transcriptional regulator n=1 Tax=Pseudactinotalea suaedae TaxID=1524924 RepID=UPI0012E2F9FF|nr:LacI family DNA-binding transcriptional regulator [Pseudactinotalea suaedae]